MHTPKMIFLIFLGIILSIFIWGLLTEWKFISPEGYTPKEIRDIILNKCEKDDSSSFSKKFKTILEDKDGKYSEIELSKK